MWNAQSPMKEYLSVCLASGLLAFSSRAQESAPAPGAPALDAAVPKIATASADDEAYAALLQSQLEFKTQIKLLSNLTHEHRKRAEEATKADQAQKALWENELAKELGDRSEALLKQLNGVTKQRLAFEQAHTNAAASVDSLNAAMTAIRPSPQEIEFISKLDERLDRVTQELLTARQYANAYAERMHTNTAAYDFEKAASAVEQNTIRIRRLEQEQSDLELRKLEFQALRRP
jgi:hypothetical protein